MTYIRRRVVVQFGKTIKEMTKKEFEYYQKQGWIFKPCTDKSCKTLDCKGCIKADAIIDKMKFKKLKE